jgi:hypothetical protein
LRERLRARRRRDRPVFSSLHRFHDGHLRTWNAARRRRRARDLGPATGRPSSNCFYYIQDRAAAGNEAGSEGCSGRYLLHDT